MKATDVLQFYPTEHGIKLVPLEGTGRAQTFTDLDGKVKRLASATSGPTRCVGDDSDRETLTIFVDDLPYVEASLSWRSVGGEASLVQPEDVSQHKGETIEILARGKFSQPLDKETIHSIIGEYRLLGKKFPNRADIFREKIGSNSLTETLIMALLKGAQDLTLPEWARKVVELREQAKEAKGPGQGDEFGWE